MRPSLKRHVLAILRETLGMTQKDLADYVDCSESTLQAVERGPKRLKLSKTLAIKISLAAGVDVEWLLANDRSCPIKPSHEACRLYAEARGERTEEYSPGLFDVVQASKSKPPGGRSVYYEVLFALEDHARLRAVIENARHNHLYDLARFKLSQFIDQFEKEFGSDPTVFERDAADPDQAIAFMERELNAAQEYSALADYDPARSEFSTYTQKQTLKRRGKMEASSPYPKHGTRKERKTLTEDDL